MLSHRDPNKAQRYLSLLDDARCSANWNEAARLRLKIAKHFPDRKCLQDTVATEYVLATHLSKRPSTSSSLPSFDYGERIPAILTAIKYGNPTPQDTFQAQICLAWLHWSLNEPALALSRLPLDLVNIQDRLTQTEKTLSGWTHVCIVKSGYLQGICQENTGDLSGAAETYKSMLPYILKAETLASPLGELRVWIQRLLARHCLLLYHFIKSGSPNPEDLLTSSSPITFTLVLTTFRAWAEFWEVTSHQPPEVTTFSFDRGDVSRRLVWQAYYKVLSLFIRMRSIFPLSMTADEFFKQQATPYDVKFFSESRLQQCVELKQVQSIYENFLVSELAFPKANEATPEIEIWVDQVVENWKITCGPTWHDEDHIGGGKEATGRQVLDILYRAATRSFHSTRVLRHLFTVHTSLGEFDLGKKALDSYLDIVSKGKARVEKPGEPEVGLDDDATIIRTASLGIQLLCLYNRWEEGKRSKEIGIMLEEWIQRHNVDVSSTNSDTNNSPNLTNGDYSTNNTRLTPTILASGFCASAISQMHWAKLTYDISERATYQAQALTNFRMASRFQARDQANIKNLYDFALALSMNRDIASAISIVKKALSSDARGSANEDSTPETPLNGSQLVYDYQRRQKLKCWHLLALLLSAKQNFSTAIASCEAALELFGLGSANSNHSRSELTVSNIEFSDRERIIEISMTRLALVEVVDGPEEAINHFRDLLELFGKCFDYSEKAMGKDVAFAQVSPPVSRNGTIKSFRSSFLGRSRSNNRKPSETKVSSKPPTTGSFESISGPIQKTPTISVTAEDSAARHGTFHPSHHFPHLESRKLRKRNSKKSMSSGHRGRSVSMIEKPTTNGIQLQSNVPIHKGQDDWRPVTWSDDDLSTHGQHITADEVGIAISHDIPPLPRPPAFAPSSNNTDQMSQPKSSSKESSRVSSLPATQPPLPIKVSFPETLPPPPPLFSAASQTRRSLSLLAKIWLQVAALYRRAKLPTDSSGAVSEALRHISTVENLVALKHSSAELFSTPDWGGIPSVSELWADAFSERARLHEFLEERDEAEADYETALTHFPDHPGAIIGLSNILLEFYSQKESSSYLSPSTATLPSSSPKSTPLLAPNPPRSSAAFQQQQSEKRTEPIRKDNDENDASVNNETDDPLLLSRLSARDRATGLLSSLTRSGQGWDCAEAWFALARAYELRGQVDKAKEALWWVVELEESRPVRGWGCLQW